MGDDGSDAVMYMAFFGRGFFGLAVVCLAFALALTGVSTLHAKVYTFRGAAPHFVTLARMSPLHPTDWSPDVRALAPFLPFSLSPFPLIPQTS